VVTAASFDFDGRHIVVDHADTADAERRGEFVLYAGDRLVGAFVLPWAIEPAESKQDRPFPSADTLIEQAKLVLAQRVAGDQFGADLVGARLFEAGTRLRRDALAEHVGARSPVPDLVGDSSVGVHRRLPSCWQLDIERVDAPLRAKLERRAAAGLAVPLHGHGARPTGDALPRYRFADVGFPQPGIEYVCFERVPHTDGRWHRLDGSVQRTRLTDLLVPLLAALAAVVGCVLLLGAPVWAGFLVGVPVVGAGAAARRAIVRRRREDVLWAHEYAALERMTFELPQPRPASPERRLAVVADDLVHAITGCPVWDQARACTQGFDLHAEVDSIIAGAAEVQRLRDHSQFATDYQSEVTRTAATEAALRQAELDRLWQQLIERVEALYRVAVTVFRLHEDEQARRFLAVTNKDSAGGIDQAAARGGAADIAAEELATLRADLLAFAAGRRGR